MPDKRNAYEPTSDIIDSLKTGTTPRRANLPQVVPEGDALVPMTEEEREDERSKTMDLAVDHVKDTLFILKGLMQDIAELAPASQQGFFYQTAATLAKTRLEGSHLLAALAAGSIKPITDEKKGEMKSNHLHLNVTSAEFNNMISTQIKKAKNAK